MSTLPWWLIRGYPRGRRRCSAGSTGRPVRQSLPAGRRRGAQPARPCLSPAQSKFHTTVPRVGWLRSGQPVPRVASWSRQANDHGWDEISTSLRLLVQASDNRQFSEIRLGELHYCYLKLDIVINFVLCRTDVAGIQVCNWLCLLQREKETLFARRFALHILLGGIYRNAMPQEGN